MRSNFILTSDTEQRGAGSLSGEGVSNEEPVNGCDCNRLRLLNNEMIGATDISDDLIDAVPAREHVELEWRASIKHAERERQFRPRFVSTCRSNAMRSRTQGSLFGRISSCAKTMWAHSRHRRQTRLIIVIQGVPLS